MLSIEKPLPGEWEGTLNPEDYGFGVIRDESITRWEEDERAADLYRRVLDRTGMRIPGLDPVLARVDSRRQVMEELDRNPAQALFERHKIGYPYSCTFGSAHLTIDEGVFCPTFTNVSALLLSAIDFKSGEKVLDAFAGSGAFGVNAALHGAATVVSVDISERAVGCIEKNARNNGVQIEARLGTLNDRVAKDERFDLIIANPPLLPGEPTDGITAAVFDEGLQVTLDFINQLSQSLDRKGRCYLVTSDILERCKFSVPELCRKAGLRTIVMSTADFGYETYRVHKIEHRQLNNLHWLFRQ
ncbi:MAG TPA: class I SAM-dependent methyltransferase [Candidatus Saccharimonadales bacterium]|nr:class I SAM-dependent methyltransferase [Candidatus Saccharimonadales bacterium]